MTNGVIVERGQAHTNISDDSPIVDQGGRDNLRGVVRHPCDQTNLNVWTECRLDRCTESKITVHNYGKLRTHTAMTRLLF